MRITHQLPIHSLVLGVWALTSMGCALPAPNVMNPLTKVVSGPSAESITMARRVAHALRLAFPDSIALIGAKVAVNPNSPQALTYDFTEAPTSGYVRISSTDFSMPVSASELFGEKGLRVAALDPFNIRATRIAVDIALAAARAIAQNFIDHPGQAIDQTMLVQKVVASMAQAVGNRLGLSLANVDWAPVASQIITSMNSTALEGVMTTAMGFIGTIKGALLTQFSAQPNFIARAPRLTQRA